jgi:hypothetical protein
VSYTHLVLKNNRHFRVSKTHFWVSPKINRHFWVLKWHFPRHCFCAVTSNETTLDLFTVKLWKDFLEIRNIILEQKLFKKFKNGHENLLPRKSLNIMASGYPRTTSQNYASKMRSEYFLRTNLESFRHFLF